MNQTIKRIGEIGALTGFAFSLKSRVRTIAGQIDTSTEIYGNYQETQKQIRTFKHRAFAAKEQFVSLGRQNLNAKTEIKNRCHQIKQILNRLLDS